MLINSTLFTSIRFLAQEHSLLPEKVLIETLTDMIVALLELPAAQPDLV